MSRRYRISPQGPPPLTDAEIAKHKDARRLIYNYHRATRPLYKQPLYRDRKAFFALLLIVLLAIFIAEVVEKEKAPEPPPQPEQGVKPPAAG
jgi:hypothetical protein